ncbi:MAG: flagellar hook-length control protein FliK [Planctomycetaceae bacterium]
MELASASKVVPLLQLGARSSEADGPLVQPEVAERPAYRDALARSLPSAPPEIRKTPIRVDASPNAVPRPPQSASTATLPTPTDVIDDPATLLRLAGTVSAEVSKADDEHPPTHDLPTDGKRLVDGGDPYRGNPPLSLPVTPLAPANLKLSQPVVPPVKVPVVEPTVQGPALPPANLKTLFAGKNGAAEPIATERKVVVRDVLHGPPRAFARIVELAPTENGPDNAVRQQAVGAQPGDRRVVAQRLPGTPGTAAQVGIPRPIRARRTVFVAAAPVAVEGETAETPATDVAETAFAFRPADTLTPAIAPTPEFPAAPEASPEVRIAPARFVPALPSTDGETVVKPTAETHIRPETHERVSAEATETDQFALVQINTPELAAPDVAADREPEFSPPSNHSTPGRDPGTSRIPGPSRRRETTSARQSANPEGAAGPETQPPRNAVQTVVGQERRTSSGPVEQAAIPLQETDRPAGQPADVPRSPESLKSPGSRAAPDTTAIVEMPDAPKTAPAPPAGLSERIVRLPSTQTTPSPERVSAAAFSIPAPVTANLEPPAPEAAKRVPIAVPMESREKEPDSPVSVTAASVPNAGHASRPVASADSPETRPADVAQQVLNAARAAIERNRPFRVTLQPPELGTLQVEIDRTPGGMSVRLGVETALAQQALQERLTHLRSSLARNGVAVERIDVPLIEPRFAHHVQAFNGPDDGENQPQQHNRHNGRSFGNDEPAEEDDEQTDEFKAGTASRPLEQPRMDAQV